MNVLLSTLLYVILIVLISKIFKIKKILKIFLCNYIIILSFFIILNFENKEIFYIDLLFLCSIKLFIIWFYFTFVDGFSSKLLLFIKKDKKTKKLIRRFISKNKKNKIIAERINYLKKGNYIYIRNNKIFLKNKIKPIVIAHNLVSNFLGVKKSGGIQN